MKSGRFAGPSWREADLSLAAERACSHPETAGPGRASCWARLQPVPAKWTSACSLAALRRVCPGIEMEVSCNLSSSLAGVILFLSAELLLLLLERILQSYSPSFRVKKK